MWNCGKSRERPNATWASAALLLAMLARVQSAVAADLKPAPVDGQPLAANVRRVLQALDALGSPLPAEAAAELEEAAKNRDARRLQQLLDPFVLCAVTISPEVRVKVERGPAKGALQQAGYTPVLVKVQNQSGVTKALNIVSPQSGPVYAGPNRGILERQAQTNLKENENTERSRERFLAVEMQTAPPMTSELSGLSVEYQLALIYSSEAGRREATIGFDVGDGNQDLGARGETPILFDVRPAVPVKLSIHDADGTPSVARLQIADGQGHVYPPQAKRLAPDFFFQPQIYRRDGDTVLLPPGEFTLTTSRGPEYVVQERRVTIPAAGPAEIAIALERWINPMDYGFYAGDHHIHAAGCSHYTSPTEGVTPEDMFLQVKGEGLNVGCVLTWGPCFGYQRRFFSPTPHGLSDPHTVLKYDLEISGFGSQALGHVCLLNLQDQVYPGSEGTETKGWPTWTTPVMRWAKQQGGVTGYAHSASGLEINPPAAAKRLFDNLDADKNGSVTLAEAAQGLLPEAFDKIDADRDGILTEAELVASLDRAAEKLPNLAIPEMNGAGAMEISVSVAEGVCDFISAMDTPRIQEWNTWYHLLNCGFPLKVSGETDFPCMSSRQVGQGRVYVQLGNPERVDFADWCRGLARGQSYVSDGYGHALRFAVNGAEPGTTDVDLKSADTVTVRATVAFARETPLAVAHGGILPAKGKRLVGDTVHLHAPRSADFMRGGERQIEVVANGVPVATKSVPADGKVHELEFEIPLERSSWIALRQFPQLHTNPVNIIVGGKPIRASRSSARWCAETIELLWKNRENKILPAERDAARQTFQNALKKYRTLAAEAPEGT